MHVTVVVFVQLFARFWERHHLNIIHVWEFPEYLWLSLPSGLHCEMSYLMQPDKQWACTDSIKGNEWSTHMGGLSCAFAHWHANISRFWQSVSLSIHILLHSLMKIHPLYPTPALQLVKTPSTKHLLVAKAPLDAERAVWWHAPFGLITRFAKLRP